MNSINLPSLFSMNRLVPILTMNHLSRTIITFGVAALTSLASCATVSAEYTAPRMIEHGASEWSREIDVPRDEVWSALIEHVATTFFGIDNFEKDSGLITLSFGASDLGKFIDGGHWVYKQTAGSDLNTGVRVPALSFDGNYATFLEMHRSAALVGKMNLFVKDVDERGTRVSVRARYVVTFSGETWAFDTGEYVTRTISNPVKGTSSIRAMTPTHLAEKTILDAVEVLSKN